MSGGIYGERLTELQFESVVVFTVGHDEMIPA